MKNAITSRSQESKKRELYLKGKKRNQLREKKKKDVSGESLEKKSGQSKSCTLREPGSERWAKQEVYLEGACRRRKNAISSESRVRQERPKTANSSS